MKIFPKYATQLSKTLRGWLTNLTNNQTTTPTMNSNDDMKSALADQRPLPRKKLSRVEGMALNALVKTLNDPRITGAKVPEGVRTELPLAGGATLVTEPMPEMAVPPAGTPIAAPTEPLPAVAPDFNRLFFTGRALSGKDHCATAAGAQIFGFAEPLYALQELFFPGSAKDAARGFLQKAGQYGRGTVSEEYPLSVERALFCDAIRRLAAEGKLPDHVDWSAFGADDNIWLNAAMKRVEQAPPGRVAITNVRFTNELRRLQSEGWQHIHCLCSPQTWAARLALVGSKPTDPKYADVSERLAAHFDGLAIKEISQRRSGSRLNVIWNDDKVPSPSPRFWTLPEWLTHIGPGAVVDPDFPQSL